MSAPRDEAFAQPGDVWPVQLATDGADPAEFAAAVVDEVRARLARHPRRTAASQSGSPEARVERLTGLDPLYVVPALDHIARSGSRTADDELVAMANAAVEQLRTPASRTRRDLRGLPTEHPLDYDWRFDRPTRGSIIDAVHHVKPDRVLLLGCPTLAVDRRMPPVPTTLIDDNPALAVSDPSNLVRHHRVDILNQPLVTAGVEADCVVADPPFYSDIVAAFLCAAAAGLHVGGHLFLVLPSRWARPAASTDADDALARDLGFTMLDRRPNAARYVTPKFERATHHRLGLPGVPNRWRTADLAQLTLSRRTLHAVPSSHSDRHLWHEVRLGEARWRIRVPTTTNPNPSIGPDLLINERPLVTVSRRDNARCDANVLTDDSRAYRSSQPDVLLHLLRARSIGRDVTAAVADLLGRPLAAQERATLDAVTSGLNRVLDSSG
jgi:hypothetical protein